MLDVVTAYVFILPLITISEHLLKEMYNRGYYIQCAYNKANDPGGYDEYFNCFHFI